MSLSVEYSEMRLSGAHSCIHLFCITLLIVIICFLSNSFSSAGSSTQTTIVSPSPRGSDSSDSGSKKTTIDGDATASTLMRNEPDNSDEVKLSTKKKPSQSSSKIESKLDARSYSAPSAHSQSTTNLSDEEGIYCR